MEAAVTPENDYQSSFAAFEESRRSDPGWLRGIRRDAFARFAETGFPTPRLEQWKYTNVAPIARTAFRLAGGGAPQRALSLALPTQARVRLVFVNGRYVRELSSGAPPRGVEVWSLAELLRRDPGRIEPHVARWAQGDQSAFTALNTAFLADGAFVAIARGAVVPEPVHLVFLSQSNGEPAFSHPRNLLLAGAGSQAKIVETYVGDRGIYFTNAVTGIVCEDAALLEHVKLQREGPSGFHVQTIQVEQRRSSHFASHNVALGGALARTDLNVLFSGEGGECALNGLFVAEGSQLVDNHTVIDHAKPHCVSRELYKGILDGKARGVFHGKIIVRPDAQKTDAMQTNRNLLLSKEALVHSIPALEIFADDVKCKHGSTIGQLDPAALFYLRSRGIGERESRALLTHAFAADVAGRIPVAPIREEIEAFLATRFGRGLEAA